MKLSLLPKTSMFLIFLPILILVSISCTLLTDTSPVPTLPKLTGTQLDTPTEIPLAETQTPVVPTITETVIPKTPTLTVVPSTPTATAVPFLPLDLAVINPENAANLRHLAELSVPGVSVTAFSPDGRLLAAGLFGGGYVKVWELNSGQVLFTLSGYMDSRILNYLSFSPDGLKLASVSQGWSETNDRLILWDVENGRMIRSFDGYLGALSPDWQTLALTERNKPTGATLKLLEMDSDKELFILAAHSDIYEASFSPDGRIVAGKMYGIWQDLFTFWEVDSGKESRTLFDWMNFGFSPDGRFIAAILDVDNNQDSGELTVFDANSWRNLKTLGRDADALWFTIPSFSPDGRILAASFSDHIKLWDTETWKVLINLPMPDKVGLAFSPNGRILVSYSHDHPAQLWGVVP